MSAINSSGSSSSSCFPEDTTAEIGDVIPVPNHIRRSFSCSPLIWKLLLVGMALMWGFSFFVMKDVLDTVPTYQLLSCRFLPAALIMFILFHERILRHLNARTLFVGIVLGVLMGGGYIFQTFGLADTTAGKNAFLTGTYCIIVPFISFFMSREKLTRFNVGAAFLCLAGIGFVALDNFSVGLGDVLTLIGAAFFAMQISTVSSYGRDLDVNVITFWEFLTVGLISLFGSILTERSSIHVDWTPQLFFTMVFLSVFCTCVALLVQNAGLAHVPSSTGSLLLSLESPFGVFFSVVMTGEVLTGRLLTGFALIFISVVLSETHFSFLRRR